jgi:hypothetical protein
VKFTMADSCQSQITRLFHDEGSVVNIFSCLGKFPIKVELVVVVNGIWRGIHIEIYWSDREGHLILACIPSFRSQYGIISK